VDKIPLILLSICAVVLLVLGSLTNVVGIENVQSCNCGDPPCWPEISGTMGDNNWYVSDVVITFNGTLNYTYYRINGGNWTEYKTPFTLWMNGIHLLEWTCDSNISNIYSVKIKIDTITPQMSYPILKRIGLFTWQYSINVSDDYFGVNVSGVNRVWCWYSNSFDTEPPYEFIWKGCWWLEWLFNLFHNTIFLKFNAWDNAGNHLIEPSYS
jgi:hypothetical protein